MGGGRIEAASEVFTEAGLELTNSLTGLIVKLHEL